MTHAEILEIIRAKKYNPLAISETDGQVQVFMESRKGVTAKTLFGHFENTRLRVVGFGWENGQHYVLFRDNGQLPERTIGAGCKPVV